MRRVFCFILLMTFAVCILSSCSEDGLADSPETSSTMTTEQSEIQTSQTERESTTEEKIEPQTTQQTEPRTEKQTEPKTEPKSTVSEADVRAFIKSLYNYGIGKGTLPQSRSVFPQKTYGAYRLPEFLDNYFYSLGESINIYNTSILTSSEVQYLENENVYPQFVIVKTSKVQGVANGIYGYGTYKFSGSIESYYSASGYYMLEGGRGGEDDKWYDSYSIDSIEIGENTVKVTVYEKWNINSGSKTALYKAVYTLGTSGSTVYLKGFSS